MRNFKCLFFSLIYGYVLLERTSGVARVKTSVDESLRDPGTYVIHFEESATDTQLQHFAKQLIRRSNRRAKFEAKIIAEYPIIKCLAARLSERALKWVRVLCH